MTLTQEERRMLQEMLSRGKVAARKLMHARILLKADVVADGPGWNDEAIAEALEVGRATVERVRKAFVEESGRGPGPSQAPPPVPAKAGWRRRSPSDRLGVPEAP